MKPIITNLLFAILCTCTLSAQNGTFYQKTIDVDGQNRQYRIYAPDSYNGTEKWPVVIIYHGFWTTVDSMVKICEMHKVADTAHFFVAYPFGLNVDNMVISANGLGWHVPGTFHGVNNQDDVRFTERLIEELTTASDLKADPSRIYAAGWSNGGEMALLLACQLSSKIAAFGVVTAQMSHFQIDSACVPDRAVSILQVVSSEDIFYNWDGDAIFPPFVGTANFWTAYGACSPFPTTEQIPDIDPSDGCTASKTTYSGCNNNEEVVLYGILNGGHTWPGGYIPSVWNNLGNINMDFHASVALWEFFKKHQHPVLSSSSPTKQEVENFKIFPNPATEQIQVKVSLFQTADFQFLLRNTLGQQVAQLPNQTITPPSTTYTWSLPALPTGVYFLEMRTDGQYSSVQKLHIVD